MHKLFEANACEDGPGGKKIQVRQSDITGLTKRGKGTLKIPMEKLEIK